MFKKLLMAVLVLFITAAAKADEGQKVASKVQKVIVFLKGAQVTRTAMVNISEGTSELVFGEISPDIDVQSIQVHANDEFTLLSVKHEMNYLGEDIKVKKVEELQAQQKIIKDKINMQNGLLSIYQQEELMLAKNQVVKADNLTLDVIKLKQALDFQTERLTSLKEKQQAVNNQVAALNIELRKYDQQIADINRGQSISTSNILVTVSSKTALQSLFTISYVVRNASWYPTYDIRAKNVNSPLSISYKANVMQKSGEEWKNVKLTLSTGSPANNSIKPELDPYYLNFIAYPALSPSPLSLNEVVVVGYGAKKSEAEADGVNELAGKVAGVNTVPVSVNEIENQTNVEFNINNPYTIQSDGKQCLVEINQIEVKAGYQYYVAPKISTDVFLTAQLTDWNNYNFLPGEANLYFEGTYIGRSLINTHNTADTLKLSLGTDKSIIVTRTLQKELSEKQIFGSNKKETRNWLIEVKNRKNQMVNLLIEDQVPVSQNSSIEVETQEATGVKPDALTGKVSWNFLLNSQEDKKVQLKYMVKYPKSQPIIVQ